MDQEYGEKAGVSNIFPGQDDIRPVDYDPLMSLFFSGWVSRAWDMLLDGPR